MGFCTLYSRLPRLKVMNLVVVFGRKPRLLGVFRWDQRRLWEITSDVTSLQILKVNAIAHPSKMRSSEFQSMPVKGN